MRPMRTKSPLALATWTVALALPLACSGSAPDRLADGGLGGTAGDDRRFVPEGLANTNLSGSDLGLVLIALTLINGPAGPELYAAVRNDDVVPACNAALVTYFLDKTGYVIASAGAGLEGGGLYQLPTGPIVTCLEPGEIGMAASTVLPDTVVIDELGSLQHQLPYFIIDGIVPIGRLGVSDVQVVTTASGSAYTGTMTNGLDATVTLPNASIFPVNTVGRPLGVATASSTIAVPAGGTWSFETTAVSDPGVTTAASATASIQ
jgi:hypothetical protein